MRCVGCACVLAVLLTACGDAAPCRDCPAIEGGYVVSWQTGTVPTNCTVAGPQPQSLSFSRTGSTVRTTVASQELVGTLYDTYDFTLNGGGVTGTSYGMHGRVITLDPSSDGGIRITGSLTTRLSGDAGTVCQAQDNFTGDKL